MADKQIDVTGEWLSAEGGGWKYVAVARDKAGKDICRANGTLTFEQATELTDYPQFGGIDRGRFEESVREMCGHLAQKTLSDSQKP